MCFEIEDKYNPAANANNGEEKIEPSSDEQKVVSGRDIIPSECNSFFNDTEGSVSEAEYCSPQPAPMDYSTGDRAAYSGASLGASLGATGGVGSKNLSYCPPSQYVDFDTMRERDGCSWEEGGRLDWAFRKARYEAAAKVRGGQNEPSPGPCREGNPNPQLELAEKMEVLQKLTARRDEAHLVKMRQGNRLEEMELCHNRWQGTGRGGELGETMQQARDLEREATVNWTILKIATERMTQEIEKMGARRGVRICKVGDLERADSGSESVSSRSGHHKKRRDQDAIYTSEEESYGGKTGKGKRPSRESSNLVTSPSTMATEESRRVFKGRPDMGARAMDGSNSDSDDTTAEERHTRVRGGARRKNAMQLSNSQYPKPWRFEGEDHSCIEDWLLAWSHYNAAAGYEGEIEADQMKRFLGTKVHTKLTALDLKDKQNPRKLRAFLRRTYGAATMRERAKREFGLTVQAPTETFREFMDRLKSKRRQGFEGDAGDWQNCKLTKEEIACRFLDGIRDREVAAGLQLVMRVTGSRNRGDKNYLSSLVDNAEEEWSLMRKSADKASVTKNMPLSDLRRKTAADMLKTISTTGETGVSHIYEEEEEVKVMGNRQPREATGDDQCHNCHQMGHFARDCPTKRQAPPRQQYRPQQSRYGSNAPQQPQSAVPQGAVGGQSSEMREVSEQIKAMMGEDRDEPDQPEGQPYGGKTNAE